MAKKPTTKAAGAVDTRHYDVIVAPHITEKSTLLSENNAVVFKAPQQRCVPHANGVAPSANAARFV